MVLTTGLAGLLTLPRTITDMDGAEFALIAARGGIAHPPGYPLYSAMLRGWHEAFARWFASGDVTAPGVLAVMSVAMSMATAWLIWVGITTVQNRPRLAAAATLIVMLASPVWRASTGLEPFALNDLMGAGLMFLAASSLAGRKGLAFPTGMVFGLAFCNHHSLAFAFPLALPALALAAPSALTILERTHLRSNLTTAAGGFILGLLPLVWFATQRNNTAGFVWGDWSDFLSRLDNHLFRRNYGTLSLKAGADGGWLSGPLFMLKVYGQSLSWIWLAVAIWGGFSGINAFRKFEWACLAAFLSTGIVMPMLFRMEAASDTAEIMRRFGALPLIFLAPAIAIGLARLQARLPANLPVRWHHAPAATLIIVIGLHGLLQFKTSNRRLETLADTHLSASLAALQQVVMSPRSASPQKSQAKSQAKSPWIVTNTDLDFFGFTYKTATMMPKPVVIQTGLWPSLWYRRQSLKFLAESGVQISPEAAALLLTPLAPDEDFKILQKILFAALRDHRLFLSAGVFPGMNALIDTSYPVASFIQPIAAGNEAEMPPHSAMIRINEHFSQPVLAALEGNTWQTYWEHYSLDGWRRTWTALAAASESTADSAELKICTDTIKKLGPASGPDTQQIP